MQRQPSITELQTVQLHQ